MNSIFSLGMCRNQNLFTNSVAPVVNQRILAKQIELLIFIRTHEHAISDQESSLYKHLRTCEHLIFIRNLCNLPDTLNTDNALLTIPCNKEYFTQ